GERGGRERRERGGERQGEAREPHASAEPVESPADAGDGSAPRSYFARRADADAPAAPVALADEASNRPAAPVQQAPAATNHVANGTPAQPVATPVAAAPAGLPKVAPFSLPADELARIADAAGLNWVNSDADKVAAVQAAIAAEPRPIRVPRERPPVVELDDGPLVLVETRKDLREVTLPFEQAPH
ncbi:MAG: ribonuclease E/G, partial [Ottowia sp.]